ncbi:hypothetical protein BDB00DRAFT_811346 [Zychaea mexicana]|uniref:uncharacterized protein n=1 Tax=Zychaea mexicana TaxID=64656 RepID=UPI0022FED106|nr:uncharacterized protein BDB00DRAFT_811346 [Zychaea mexicana]KAI9495999.1 hypothetical protein BDB00DRAFT_811346 [Zychaea mexicana]
MPSFFKHDRSNDLFPPTSQRRGGKVFPVARVTRKDIESRLQKQIESRLKVKKIYADHLEQQQQQRLRLRLKPVPSFQLFPDESSVTAAPDNNGVNVAERGLLSLRRVPNFSLFGDSVATTTRSEQHVSTLRIDQYAQQRRDCVNEHRIAGVLGVGREGTAVDPFSTESIARVLLGDDTTSSSLTAPIGSTSTSSADGTPTISQETQAVPVSPQEQQEQQQHQPTEPQTSATHASVILSSVPERCIPVFATTMQKQGCDKITQTAKTRDTSFLKIRFEEMIGVLNHPLVAMMDVYEQTLNDKWSGSGKTLFIKQLVENLQAEQMSLKIAIATYDIDTESFLYDCIKNDLKLPCLRIGSILDDVWQSEYGVVFQTQKSRDTMRQNSEPNADFVIAFDVRLRPDNGVFAKIINKRGTEPVPVVWLYTVGSVEQRAISYFDRHTSDDNESNSSQWWYDRPEYRDIVLAENTWPPEEAEEETALHFAIKTLTTWAQHQFARPYLLSVPTATVETTSLPLPQQRQRRSPSSAAAEVPVTTASTIPSSSSITAAAVESQAIVPQPTTLPVATEQFLTSSPSPSPSSVTPAITFTPPAASEPANTAVQRVPEITELSTTQTSSTAFDMEIATQSDVDVTDVLSDMEVDSERHAEHNELPDCIKAQIKQILQYPTLQASFDRPFPGSRHGSPSILHRSRSRHSRGRESNAEVEEDDDASSFYSASESVQDFKPMFAANLAAGGASDLENGIATGK